MNNPGVFGSVVFPIIPPPQAAIITMEAIVPRPVVRDDVIAVRNMMVTCLSFDRRVVDEAAAGAFLGTVRAQLEAIGPGTTVY